MSKLLRTVIAIGPILILAGCLTRPPAINLFESGDYIMTKPPAVVAGVETKSMGIWLSKDAVTRLQQAGALAGKIEE